MSDDLTSRIRALIDRAERSLPDESAAEVAGLRARLDGPMRVALAGRLKAGKSTLLNALIGVRLAPTDASECTRVVSWYRHGSAPQVTLVSRSGGSEVLGSWSRTDGELDIPLDDHDLDEIDHLDIGWPTGQLEQLVLIDTPGLASASASISARTTRFLLGRDDTPGDADAVIYLLRHAHPTDLSFLEAFRDVGSDAVALNAIGVVSRADEVGGGGLQAMTVARAAAARLAAHPDLRRRCQVVVPLAGLLAQGAMAYSETDHQALRAVAAEPLEVRRRLLLSATRFTNDETMVVPTVVRHRLVTQIGLFGVRYVVELLAERDRPSHEISSALVEISGLGELEGLLRSQLAARAQVLKCRSALKHLDAVAKRHDSDDAAAIRDAVRMVEIESHAFAELAALQRLRSGEVDGDVVDVEAAERLLGGVGVESWARLALDPSTDRADLRTEVIGQVAAWRSQAEHPLLGRSEREVCGAVRRSLEGLAVELDDHEARPDDGVAPA